MKICSRCQLTKDESCFSKRGSGLQTFCKECNKLYLKSHYRANTAYYKEKSHNYESKVADEFHRWLAQQSCMDCGISDIRVLEFDHKRDKLHNVSEILHSGSREALWTEIAKCEVVCANCHKIRTSSQQGWRKSNGKWSNGRTAAFETA